MVESELKEHPVGTRVRVNCFGSRAHGQECTVLSGRQKQGGGFMGQEVSIPMNMNAPRGKRLAFEFHELEPV